MTDRNTLIAKITRALHRANNVTIRQVASQVGVTAPPWPQSVDAEQPWTPPRPDMAEVEAFAADMDAMNVDNWQEAAARAIGGDITDEAARRIATGEE